MKFAVDRCLAGKKYETAAIGESLERVMRYWTVRGVFQLCRGVHPELRKIGVQRIDFTDVGLVFEGDISDVRT